MVFACYRDAVNNGQYYGVDTDFSWNADEEFGCRPLLLEERQPGLDHLIAVDGVEVLTYNTDAIAERQVVLELLDGSVRLAATVGALLGMTVLF